jgi:hypothetical protein
MGFAWGGHTNGRIPLSELTYIKGGYLRSDAANAYAAMAAEFEQTFGKPLFMSEGYRDYDTQVYMKAYWTSQGKPQNAAAPGGSIHGWALATDIDLTGLTNEQINWLHTRGRDFGFDWETTGRPLGEAWHLDFTLTQTAGLGYTPIEEDDFLSALTDEQQLDFYNKLNWLYNNIHVDGQPYSTIDMIKSNTEPLYKAFIEPSALSKPYRPVDVLMSFVKATLPAVEKLIPKTDGAK